jgi:long-chain acyl-CoA synthetase
MATVVRVHVDRAAHDAAVIDEWGSTSWAELDERVNRLIDHLRGAGLEPGDRVALLAGNRREIEEVYLACSHAGWHCVPVNWHFAADEVAYVFADSEARALISASEFAGLAADALVIEPDSVPLSRLVMSDQDDTVDWGEPGGRISAETRPVLSSYEDALAAASNEEPDDQMLGGVMFYTSGTTGRPKGVRTAWEPGTPVEVLQLMAGSMDSMKIPDFGRTLLAGPQYHSAQWAFSYLPLLAGSTVVMQAKFIPEQTLEMIDTHDITNVHLVPTQFVRLLRVDEDRKAAFRGSELSAVLHGAAPCAPNIKRSMIEWWGPKITEYYGATEGGVVSTITSEEWLERPGSVGVAAPIVEFRIVNEAGFVAAPMEEGVIHIRSLIGRDFEYHNSPDKTAEAHSEPGFMTMGDIGYLDDAGYLYLSDRKIDMVVSGGVNIYPAEIEAVLITHPSVLDVAVFGVPDEEFGEQVKAVVQLDDGIEWSDALEAEMTELSRSQLAGYKRPKSWETIDEMPRSAAGKLLKRVLRAPYWEGLGRKI